MISSANVSFQGQNLYLLFFGPPGSGKGTQSAFMIQDFSLYFICTGELLRKHIRQKSELGCKAQSFMDEGLLVPDALMLELIEEALKEMDQKGHRGFVLDGFPRTPVQAQALDELLTQRGISLSQVLFLNVKKDLLLERIEGRRFCPQCGKVYHLRFVVPKVGLKCDDCSQDLERRPDDRREVILRRLKVYEQYTEPLKKHYKEQGNLLEVDCGEDSPKEIHLTLSKQLGLKP